MPSRPTILVAEGDAAVRAALSFAFELEGFRVETFADAEAMRLAVLPERGCLIADHALGGRHGLAVLRDLQTRRPDLSAILMATHPEPAIRAEAAQARIPIVEKPLLGDALAACVRDALGEGR